MASGGRATKKVAPVLGGFNSADYVTKRTWATAPDGVKVPVTYVYRCVCVCARARARARACVCMYVCTRVYVFVCGRMLATAPDGAKVPVKQRTVMQGLTQGVMQGVMQGGCVQWCTGTVVFRWGRGRRMCAGTMHTCTRARTHTRCESYCVWILQEGCG